MKKDQEESLKLALVKFSDRIKQWEDAHRTYHINRDTKEIELGECRLMPPLRYDGTDWHWVNRAVRRRK